MGAGRPPEWLKRVKEDYFKAGDDFLKSYTPAELLETMDAAGVEKAIITTDVREPSDKLLEFPERSDRFALAVGADIKGGMKSLWKLEELVKRHRVVMAKVIPFMEDLPPNHRKYYPLYTKCVELDLPISINTGIPGPPMPGECQHPMHLDRVCLDFPMLKIIMAHGADPWWAEASRLMIKYKNLYLMTSAYRPRYFPPDFVHFMNTRGRNKVLFASDHPVLSMETCLKDAQALDLREGVLEKYLYENAEQLLFAERKPRY